jgi:nucleoside-diphosphate kinase
MERTFIAVKPDGVQRGLVGQIIARFEQKGYQLVGLKQMQVTREMAEQHYGEHRERPFFKGLVDFITSGPIVAMAWQGPGIVATARLMMGKTNPRDAEPGTIRGDFAVDIGRNVVHGSDSPENAVRELGIFFGPGELLDWNRTLDAHLME